MLAEWPTLLTNIHSLQPGLSSMQSVVLGVWFCTASIIIAGVWFGQQHRCRLRVSIHALTAFRPELVCSIEGEEEMASTLPCMDISANSVVRSYPWLGTKANLHIYDNRWSRHLPYASNLALPCVCSYIHVWRLPLRYQPSETPGCVCVHQVFLLLPHTLHSVRIQNGPKTAVGRSASSASASAGPVASLMGAPLPRCVFSSCRDVLGIGNGGACSWLATDRACRELHF